MKLHLVATAALLAAAGSAHALSPAVIDASRGAGLKEIVLFGASAQTPMVAAYMKNVVCSGAADYDEYRSGSNFFAYSCTTPNGTNGFPINTKVLLVKKDQGGAIMGVNPVARNIPGQSMIVSVANCPGFVHGTTTTCSVGATDQAIPVAGISDAEPALFVKKQTKVGTLTNQYLNHPDLATNDDLGNPWVLPTTAQLNSMDVAATGQTLFGVGVNKALRDKLQAAQGLGVGLDDDANMPSLSYGFITAALSGFVRPGIANYGDWSAVTKDTADKTKNLVICRRVRGSGTQTVSNAYFMNMATQVDTSVGMLSPLASGVAANTDALAVDPKNNGSTLASVVVNEGSGTGNVETCLQAGTHLGSSNFYALGVVSREKNPLVPPVRTYRFVRIDGALPNQAVARIGGYGFLYDSSMQWRKTTNPPPADVKTFLTKMRSAAVTSNSIAVYAATGAETAGGLLALPSKWQQATGQCFLNVGDPGYDADDALYGSCVDRLNVLDTVYNPGLGHLYGTTAAYKTNSAGVLKLVR